MGVTSTSILETVIANSLLIKWKNIFDRISSKFTIY